MSDAYRDAWLSECWAVCREVPREERAEKRKSDRLSQQLIEDRDGLINAISTDCPQAVQIDAQGVA